MSGELRTALPREALAGSGLGRYLDWLAERTGRSFGDYRELHQWSVAELEQFWASVWEFFSVKASTPYEQVLTSRDLLSARWFTGATLNYAEHVLAAGDDSAPAIVGYSQTRPERVLTFGELREAVASARTALLRLGVGPGDRVAAYLPNIPETIAAFLATASLGAVWACCAPEFGAPSVLDRFAQVEPRVLLTVSGYRYGTTDIDRSAEVAAIRAGLPTVTAVIQVPYGESGPGAEALPDVQSWTDLTAEPGSLEFEPVPFDAPLYVVFSSGTTGRPKAITHGHGGILVEHLKNHVLHWDLGPADRLLWFTTTAWMMWNTLVSALLTGASVVTMDGNPLWPDLREQWRLAQDSRATLVGASPGYVMACRDAGVHPAREFDLASLRQLGVAGSPLPPDGFRWIDDEFGAGVLLNVGSGGTDVCTGLVQAGPWQPVVVGEMSGASLGVDVQAWNDAGEPVIGELGELVITVPMPSMPVGFWGDTDGSLYRAAYFDTYPGIWRHGDWVRFSESGSCVITGRSDATLNRGGVRLGTAEFYRVVEALPQVADSLVVHVEDDPGTSGELLLFLVLRDGCTLDEELVATVRSRLRAALSPRHLPDGIAVVRAIPRNRTGKKLEVPVKRLLQEPDSASRAGRPDSLADPTAWDDFAAFASRRRRGTA